MAEKSNVKPRGPGRPIQKGQVLNPGGRPKVPQDVKDACKAASIEAIETLLWIMRNDESGDNERIKAANIILNRAWGTPTQAIELSGHSGEAMKLIIEYANKA